MLRVQVAASREGSQPPSAPEVPAGASALSEACIQCARHSTQLLTQAWIDGSFVAFDCFFTQYLFSSLTVLAISSILDGKDDQAVRGSFEEASRLLNQLKDAGSHVVHEYCHHVNAIEAALNAHTKMMMHPETLSVLKTSIIPEPTMSQLKIRSSVWYLLFRSGAGTIRRGPRRGLFTFRPANLSSTI